MTFFLWTQMKHHAHAIRKLFNGPGRMRFLVFIAKHDTLSRSSFHLPLCSHTFRQTNEKQRLFHLISPLKQTFAFDFNSFIFAGKPLCKAILCIDTNAISQFSSLLAFLFSLFPGWRLEFQFISFYFDQDAVKQLFESMNVCHEYEIFPILTVATMKFVNILKWEFRTNEIFSCVYLENKVAKSHEM